MRAHGFSLVEMFLVVAVIGVLATLAFPAMQDFAIRRQIREGMALAELPKAGVARVYAVTGVMAPGNAEAGIPPADQMVGNFVKNVVVEQGAITITFGNNASKAIHDKKLTIRPAVVAAHRQVPIAWICNQVAVPQNMEIRGDNKTDIQMSWLPVDCRGTDRK